MPIRPRRLRATAALRGMVRENHLHVCGFIYPLFITHGQGVRQPIPSMPGVFRVSVDRLEEEAGEIRALGIPAVLLFGIPAGKDTAGSESFADDGIVQLASRELKRVAPELLVIADTCMCEYTSHGHCGILSSDGHLLNDDTLEALGRIAVSQARAGADIVAPSGMIDGMVSAIRSSLDAEGFQSVAVMSYAVKYASAFYGPFRDAADGAPQFGDRRSHQMDPGNVREALREAALDVKEGADFLIVKPALPYLDVVRAVRGLDSGLPVVAYNVSGEYSMIKAAAARSWIDERAAVLEALLGMRRAGADIIITYHAKDVARWLREGN